MALSAGQYQNNQYDELVAAALAKQRQGERDFTNSQPYVAPGIPAVPDPQGSFGESDFAPYLGANNPEVGGLDWSSQSFNPDFSVNWSYQGPSAHDMAQKQYDPMYEMLRKMTEQTGARYDAGAQKVGAMYDQYGNDIRGRQGDVRAQYDASGQRIGDAYNQAINNVAGTTEKNQQAMAEMMARLGIANQAAPDSLARMHEGLLDRVGGLASQQGANVAANAQFGQNQLSYNDRAATNAGLAGSNQVADINTRKNAALSDLDLKRLELMSQQAAAENQYEQAIQKMSADQSSNGFDQWLKLQNLDMDKAKFALDQAKYGTDVQNKGQQFGLDQEKALASSGDPTAQLANKAGQLIPGAGAAAAVQQVLNTYNDVSRKRDVNGNAPGQGFFGDTFENREPTLADYQKEVTRYARTDQESRILQDLMTLYYQKLGNQQPYGYAQ